MSFISVEPRPLFAGFGQPLATLLHANILPMEGEVGTDIGIKLLPVMWAFFLHSKTPPLFMKYSNGTSTQCYAYQYPSLFPVIFLQSLYVPIHLLVQ